MFAIRLRVSPWSARSSPRSVGRVTRISPSRSSICMRDGIVWASWPLGPSTVTRPGRTTTETPSGREIGFLPIRLMRLPDERDDLAAHAFLLGGAGGDEALRGGQDRDAHAAEDARKAVLAGVDAAAGLRDPLQVGDDPLAAAPVLELDHELVEALAGLDAEVADVALLLQEAGDLHLHARGRHARRRVQRLVGVADAREHVCNRVGQQRLFSYQLLLVMPGIAPLWASSRRQMRHRPNFLNTARGRPHRLQRV